MSTVEAGDPLHDAFLAHLVTVAGIIGIAEPWRVVDTRNTGVNPDAGAPYIDFEIISGGEKQASWGAPRQNHQLETGQITINFNMPLGEHQKTAGRYAWLLLEALRTDHCTFEAAGRTVTLFEPIRMGGGDKKGGLWSESMAVAYELYHVG
ncbi:MAG: hypothetical protein AB7I59_22680 [Geminicoccaceae bacterium]